jgi:hypothetical protein
MKMVKVINYSLENGELLNVFIISVCSFHLKIDSYWP